MKRRASKLTSLAFVISFLTNACTSTPPRRPRGPIQQPIEKEGQKVPGGEIQTSGDPSAAVPPTSAAGADIPSLWARVNNLAQPLNDEDIMKATQLYPTQPNSLEEAVFVVTQMRILRNEWENKTSFQTRDLHTQEKADNTAGLSLEKTFADLQVDLAAVLKSNPHLKNHESLKLAKQLVTTTKNSDSYRAGLLGSIHSVGAQWPDIIADEGPAAEGTTAVVPPSPSAAGSEPGQVPSSAPATDPTATAGSAAPAAPTSNLDLMGSDTLLIAAQKLADKRDYKSAIDHVSRIKKEDPFYAQAQEKLKQYSTRAVKDLRAKAAEAFSNAVPLNDSNAKANYLRQAKVYLEQALKDYPQADGLDSVKENLEAVNRGLESADKSGS